MSAGARKAGPPLAQFLARRLALIAAIVFVINSVVVGLYYGSDTAALDREIVADQAEMIEEDLDGVSLPQDAPARALYRNHPSSYAFALVDRGGVVLDAMNPDLIPPVATDIFADDWMTRLDRPDAPLLVAGHEFAGRSDGLRLVFVMTDDPMRLLLRAYLDEFYEHVWLPILPLVLLLIGANTFLIRRGLAPISAAARWARDLQPGKPTPPPDAHMPAEIADLVDATQRSVDRLVDALEAEKQHAAEAAHALRTPVAVLVARMDALPCGETTDRLRADLQALSRTVQQVLASSRAGTRLEDGAQAVDLRASAEAVTAAYAPLSYAHGRELALEVPDAPVMVRGDAEAVELALSNLVENAIWHGDGPVEITVGPGAQVTVRDHGPGLPHGHDERLFDPFWRGPGAAPGGAGLGLAIVDRVRRRLGGGVEARQANGGGALFRLTFQRA